MTDGFRKEFQEWVVNNRKYQRLDMGTSPGSYVERAIGTSLQRVNHQDKVILGDKAGGRVLLNEWGAVIAQYVKGKSSSTSNAYRAFVDFLNEDNAQAGNAPSSGGAISISRSSSSCSELESEREWDVDKDEDETEDEEEANQLVVYG